MKNYNDIQFHYQEYPEQKVYLTIGLNIGIAARYYDIDDKEIHVANLAFANLYADYGKRQLGDSCKLYVDRTVTTITQISRKETWVEDLKKLLEAVFQTEADEELFAQIRPEAVAAFEKAYKCGEFRALYKAYEYADTGKGYRLKELLKNLRELDFPAFAQEKRRLVIPDNACLFVSGNLSDVSDEEKESLDRLLSSNSRRAILGGIAYDPLLKEDAHLLELSRQRLNLDILSLGFEQKVSVMDRWIYVLLESGKLPGTGKLLHVDEFDSSVLVQTEEVEKLQNYLKRPATEEQFYQTRGGWLATWERWLWEDPLRFQRLAAELILNGISLADFLNTLSGLQYQEYRRIAAEIRPRVAEAQIVMRRA